MPKGTPTLTSGGNGFVKFKGAPAAWMNAHQVFSTSQHGDKNPASTVVFDKGDAHHHLRAALDRLPHRLGAGGEEGASARAHRGRLETVDQGRRQVPGRDWRRSREKATDKADDRRPKATTRPTGDRRQQGARQGRQGRRRPVRRQAHDNGQAARRRLRGRTRPPRAGDLEFGQRRRRRAVGRPALQGRRPRQGRRDQGGLLRLPGGRDQQGRRALRDRDRGHHRRRHLLGAETPRTTAPTSPTTSTGTPAPGRRARPTSRPTSPSSSRT